MKSRLVELPGSGQGLGRGGGGGDSWGQGEIMVKVKSDWVEIRDHLNENMVVDSRV